MVFTQMGTIPLFPTISSLVSVFASLPKRNFFRKEKQFEKQKTSFSGIYVAWEILKHR